MHLQAPVGPEGMPALLFLATSVQKQLARYRDRLLRLRAEGGIAEHDVADPMCSDEHAKCSLWASMVSDDWHRLCGRVLRAILAGVSQRRALCRPALQMTLCIDRMPPACHQPCIFAKVLAQGMNLGTTKPSPDTLLSCSRSAACTLRYLAISPI